MSNELTEWQCANDPDCRVGCLHCFETAIRAQIAAEIRAIPCPGNPPAPLARYAFERGKEYAAKVAEGGVDE